MKRPEIQAELFLSPKKSSPRDHICISLPDAENICQAANEAGYLTITKEGRNGSAWFDRDNMGNLFETKAGIH